MKKTTKKDIINIASIIIAISLFVFGHWIFNNAPMVKESFFGMWEQSETVWWSESLIAGTLGFFGLGLFSMILYPAPLMAFFGYTETRKLLLNKFVVKNNR